MTRLLRATLLLSLLGQLAACAPDVLVQQDPKALLPGPASYVWAEPDAADATLPGDQDPRVHNSIVRDALRQAIDRGLARRGYQPAASNAAWQVSYSIGLQKAVRIIDEPAEPPQLVCFAYHGCFMEDWGGVYATQSYPVNENTIVVDLSDAKTHKLAWRGLLTQEINLHRDLQADKLQKAVDALLAKLPGTTVADSNH